MSTGTIFSSLLAIVLALAIVLGLAFTVIWLLRKLQDSRLGTGDEAVSGRSLRFVRALPLGPRERLVMVESGGEQLLLGVTGGVVTLVAHWDGDGRLLGKPSEEAAVRQRLSPTMLAAMRERPGSAHDG
ncbi:flagellar biosynthetic protein FliO [Qipengyuania qiaonensis]|uniref:Flagellar protein n=1 Tax=Qipengyuania qiaonensis TaxID=2867240 RepID=A0ABS7J5X6_9SPHN|nr:flagellar biosynthetic protein FliO [Qipengyuania qiaonensis]MBX7482737.1 flagellar biosynthetic protein FliO [Qipengyuania qiaonensis]